MYFLLPQLLGMLPRPVEAALLLFPIKQQYEERRKIEDALLEREGNPLANSKLIWIKQTVCVLILECGVFAIDRAEI